jgi:5'-nucleotidase
MGDAVDVVIAGHTHSRLDLELDGKLVVGALAYGTAIGSVGLTIDRTSGDVVAKSAEVIATRHAEVRPDPELGRLVARYARRIAPVADRVIGHARHYLDKDAVDRLTVDAQRTVAGADVAFLNPGNTRAAIARGPITYADAAAVQAYEHPVWRSSLAFSYPAAAILIRMRSTPSRQTESWPSVHPSTGARIGRSSAAT